MDDGWPDNYGPEWFKEKQEEARQRKALRLAQGRTIADDDQFDIEREADEQGITVRDLLKR